MISVILPTFNKYEYVDLTLASFVNQSRSDFEIIVVDDGSADRTAEIVRSYQHRLNITYLFQENQGRSAARNRAVRHAQGAWLLFNDDDRIAHPDLLQQHMDVVDQGHGQRVSIGVKRRLLSIWRRGMLPVKEQDLLTLLARHPALIDSLAHTDILPLLSPESIIETRGACVSDFDIGSESDNYDAVIDHFSDELQGFHFSWVLSTTGNMLVARDLVLDAGMFDEHYQGWGMEDTDLGFRLYLQGARFAIARHALNFHQVHPLGSGKPGKELRERERQITLNKKYFCGKFKRLESYLFWRFPKTDLVTLNTLFDHLRSVENPVVTEEIMNVYHELIFGA